MKDIDHATECMGVRVPHSPFLNETRIKRIEQARYEGDEIAGALRVIKEGDRVLEMGAGLGIVGAVIAKNAKPEAVLSFEANPNLIPHIRALHSLNELEGIMEVRNEVVLTGSDQPKAMTFNVDNSFLASSLIKNERRKTTPVYVPTVDFAKLVEDFRPDVLVIDIEGGELDFLNSADLTGIRAVIIEFHPGVYGKSGTTTCKERLRSFGFRRVDDVSTRFVWTCERQDTTQTSPSPDGGWATEIQTFANPVICPPAKRSLVLETGVFDADGSPVSQAVHWQKERCMTVAPSLPDTAPDKLDGTWLWGGVLWQYFPHFITESITRLWALGAPEAKDLNGILFVPKNPEKANVLDFQTDFLRLMGGDLPVHVATKPVTPEKLLIPGQGFGLGQIVRGTDSFKTAMHQRFGKDVKSDGPEKLYISRSRLSQNRGALLGEAFVELYLEDQGYEVFHPQDHSLETQIARYRAAKQVIASEGSALHFYAHAANGDAKVAMITRRKSRATRFIAEHIHSFTGTPPLVIDTVRRSWLPEGTDRKRLAMGEPDFPAIQRALIDGGFIAEGATWEQPSEADIKAQLGAGFREISADVAQTAGS
ncbi:FkbM family methyltransferase [Sagittula sp. SSi028]|uniref:FkbM family methyltransferase n=1 Tax=Sagittula sp. SSi028 TaxID=3400636 RepID=UPI003AF77F40